MLASDEYHRKMLPAKAQLWDGTLADAHRFAAWVIDNGGYAEAKLIGSSPSLEVRSKSGSMQTIIENKFVAVKDADNEWYVVNEETLKKYFSLVERVDVRE